MPKTLKNGNGGTQAVAEFWMQMGRDLGEMKASLTDLNESFRKFCGNEFHEVVEKQDELEERLNSVIKTTGVIVGVASIGWLVANVLLHLFKVL